MPTAIRGTVKDTEGRPVTGARVYFTGAPVALPDIAALTGPAGEFTLTAPVDGIYSLAIAADGFKTLQRKVTVRGGESKEMTVQLAAL